MVDENLANNAFQLGKIMRSHLKAHLNPDLATNVRGRGLLNAVDIADTESKMFKNLSRISGFNLDLD